MKATDMKVPQIKYVQKFKFIDYSRAWSSRLQLLLVSPIGTLSDLLASDLLTLCDVVI